MTCPCCKSTHTTLTDTEEGWDASGEHGVHTLRRHNRCRDCGHEWTEHVTEPGWEVIQTMPSMIHTAEVQHDCGGRLVVDIDQYRGRGTVDCPGCDFVGAVDFSERVESEPEP